MKAYSTNVRDYPSHMSQYERESLAAEAAFSNDRNGTRPNRKRPNRKRPRHKSDNRVRREKVMVR
jgi:hypothetical protein